MAKPHKRKSKNSISMSSSSSSSSSHTSFTRFIYKKVPVFVSIVMVFGVIFLFSISSNMWSGIASVPSLFSIEVVNEFPHDHTAFTQGLLYAGNGTLFESTGLYGKSSVRRVALQTGKVEVLQEMEKSYFGEGLTLLDQRLFQVTWLTKTGFIYDRNNLSKDCASPYTFNIEKFTHQMKDGWGLATDGKVLFGSDGTSSLYQLDPHTLDVINEFTVKYNGLEVHYLNELEFTNGEVWANVWQTDCIARISPKDGSVLGWILLPNLREGLIAAGYHGIDVLNGIAWDSKDDRLYVTGKLWPRLYEIKLHPIKKRFDTGVIEQICIPR